MTASDSIRFPILYDVTRLALRVTRATPNGIDRVDHRLAQHFLASEPRGEGVILGPFGPRKIANIAANHVIAAIADRWREVGDPESDASYQRLRSWLTGAPGDPDAPVFASSSWRATTSSLKRILQHAEVFGRQGPLFSRGLATTAEQNSVYLNVSQFPTFSNRYFRWLDRRPDVRAVFFVHDLLPLRYPEFFPPIEHRVHTARLDVLARYASGAIVSTEATKAALQDELGARGAAELPIHVFPLAADETFHTPMDSDPLLEGARYFVAVGTIEPRKNHLLLLNIWRELAEKLGNDTPKLVLVGAVGWDCENVLDMLERCPAIRRHVVMVRGLSTPALRRTLAGARALLMPSFAEGFGLPVAEAAAAKIPVIASDIDPFRSLGSTSLTLIDPTDGPRWQEAVLHKLCPQPDVPETPVDTERAEGLDRVCPMRDIAEFLCYLRQHRR